MTKKNITPKKLKSKKNKTCVPVLRSKKYSLKFIREIFNAYMANRK